jgi:hypothetical protein
MTCAVKKPDMFGFENNGTVWDPMNPMDDQSSKRESSAGQSSRSEAE